MATKKRLIDGNALLEDVKFRLTIDHEYAEIVNRCVDITRRIIEYAPTVDAVEVVRCKDCKHWGGVTFGNVCRRWSAPLAGMKNCTKPDDFCSYGERRDEE